MEYKTTFPVQLSGMPQEWEIAVAVRRKDDVPESR
jgi:hypothetical protein